VIITASAIHALKRHQVFQAWASWLRLITRQRVDCGRRPPA
jgi:hypothetical protein